MGRLLTIHVEVNAVSQVERLSVVAIVAPSELSASIDVLFDGRRL